MYFHVNGIVIGKNYVTCKEIQEKMSENGMKIKRNELYACIKEKTHEIVVNLKRGYFLIFIYWTREFLFFMCKISY